MISETADHLPRKLPLKLAIVGGGRACKFFLESAKNDFFPLLDIQVVGVCDIDPNAEGLLLAREMGIYTTDNFRDLFKIKDLEGIVELTNDEDVFLELIKLRPKGVGVLEHDIGKLIRNLFILSQRLEIGGKTGHPRKNVVRFSDPAKRCRHRRAEHGLHHCRSQRGVFENRKQIQGRGCRDPLLSDLLRIERPLLRRQTGTAVSHARNAQDRQIRPRHP